MTTADEKKIWSEGYVEANGIRMHYWRTGDGSKPALVLCHGFSDSGLCWRPIAQMLENDFDIVMADARGHGLSDAPESGHTTDDRADDVAGLVMASGAGEARDPGPLNRRLHRCCSSSEVPGPLQ